ncbi:hypothetical protein EDB19DRAFT_1832616 [Suillus lakei]|nr:hypothetical protein EDB19DRAFT_1832616 [Suillus lakei]
MAQHMNMRQPHLNVFLSDGLGYMVTEAGYQAHLSLAMESIYQRDPLAVITVQSMLPTQIEAIFEQLVWLLLLVHIMDVLFLMQWWTFRRVNGAGQVDGEILETLWASFNKISPTAHSMSQYHQQEILDDHMWDSNWKKLVGLEMINHDRTVKTLLKKHKRAIKGISDTKPPFDELTCSLDNKKIAIWENDEKKAMEEQGEYLDIYQLKINQEGIGLEAGMVHKDDARFCWAEDEEHDWEAHVADLEDDSELVNEEISAEDMGLWMPSSVPYDQVTSAHLLALQAEELELRQGQANDCLEKVRLALGDKAIIYRQHF